MSEIVSFSLKDAPALIERLLPATNHAVWASSEVGGYFLRFGTDSA